MEKVRSMQYVYNTDALLISKPVVIRWELESGKLKWTSLSGVEIEAELAVKIEQRFNLLR